MSSQQQLLMDKHADNFPSEYLHKKPTYMHVHTHIYDRICLFLIAMFNISLCILFLWYYIFSINIKLN
jgi:hypothetical protein